MSISLIQREAFPSEHGAILTINQDAGVQADCIRTIKTTIEQLGGLDVVISNAVRLPHTNIAGCLLIVKRAGRNSPPLAIWMLYLRTTGIRLVSTTNPTVANFLTDLN